MNSFATADMLQKCHHHFYFFYCFRRVTVPLSAVINYVFLVFVIFINETNAQARINLIKVDVIKVSAARRVGYIAERNICSHQRCNVCFCVYDEQR